MLGVPVSVSSPIYVLVNLVLFVYVIFVKKVRIQFHIKTSLLIGLFVCMSLVLNTYPLFRTENTLTTISYGNNDVIVYALTPDYLIESSIFENAIEKENQPQMAHPGVSNLLKTGFRWGTPIILGNYMSIFNLKGYQSAYIIQVMLFSLLFPLVWVLYDSLSAKKSWFALPLVLSLLLFNSNLQYMLFHNFAGQIVFWGVALSTFLLYFNSDWDSKNIRKNKSFMTGTLIGLCWSVLLISYHEGAVFVIGSYLLFAIARYIQKPKQVHILKRIAHISFITVFTSAVALFHSVMFDIQQAKLVSGPIGWQKFRESIPFSNPFEMMGMYSIHLFEPMPLLVSVFVSVCVVALFIRGIRYSGQKLLSVCIVAVFLLMLLWGGIYNNNFFVYNRVATYMLPFLTIFFVIGIVSLQSKIKPIFYIFFVGSLVVLSGINSLLLTQDFKNHHMSVDASFQSLLELSLEDVKEVIYFPSLITHTSNYWEEIWKDYFLHSNYQLKSSLNQDESDELEEGALVLQNKTERYSPIARVLEQELLWENEYFKLVRACTHIQCLVEKQIPITHLTFESDLYSDIVFENGWSTIESGHRWTDKPSAYIQLYSPTPMKSLSFRARSLDVPQTIDVSLHSIHQGTVNVSSEFEDYSVKLNSVKEPIYEFEFSFSNPYRPAEILQNGDNRTLYVDFEEIRLEE